MDGELWRLVAGIGNRNPSRYIYLISLNGKAIIPVWYSIKYILSYNLVCITP